MTKMSVVLVRSKHVVAMQSPGKIQLNRACRVVWWLEREACLNDSTFLWMGLLAHFCVANSSDILILIPPQSVVPQQLLPLRQMIGHAALPVSAM